MLRYPSVFIITIYLLTACGTLQSADSPTISTAAPEQTIESSETTVTNPRNLPLIALTPVLMTQILAAEYAEAQGDWMVAYQLFYDAAERSRDPRLAQKSTRAAVFAKRHQAAAKAAKLWTELEPDLADAQQAYASLLIMLQQYDTARQPLQQALQLAATPERGVEVVVAILARAHDGTKAMDLFDTLIPVANQTAAMQLQAAQLAFDHKLYLQTEQRLIPVLDNSTFAYQAKLLQANSWYQQQRYDDALQQIDQLLQQQESSQVRLRYAQMLVDQNRIDEGYAQLSILAERMPENGDVIYGLAILAFNSNRMDEAKKRFMQLIELDSRVELATFHLGQIAEKENNAPIAMRWYHQVPQGEYYLQARMRTAVLLSQTESLQVAREYLQKIETEDENQRLQITLLEAELLQQQKQYAESMQLYNILVDQLTDNYDLLYARAMVAEKLGRIDILEADMRKIIAKDPQNHQALNALGYTLADRTNRLDEAYKLIQSAYAISADDPAILDSMGWVYYRMGRLEEALNYLQQAADKLKDGEIYAHWGEVLWVSGNQEQAKEVWQQAQQFDPTNQILRSTVQRFLD